MSKERNDFILIQLATPGKLNSIAIDTTGFDRNSPTHVFVQGCYSKDTDPQYDAFSSWISMVSESPILPGGMTSFDVSDVTDEVISHIRLYVMPDGGIQQVKVFGVPVDRNYKKGRLLLEQGLQPKAIKDKKLELDQDTVSTVEEILFDRPVVEQLNLLPVTPSLSRSESSTSPPITEYASDSTTTVVTSSQEVKIEEIEIEPPVLNTSRHTSPSSNPRKRKSVSQESSDSPEETSSSSSSSIKKQRGRPRKTVA
jgi:hypothetical protein